MVFPNNCENCFNDTEIKCDRCNKKHCERCKVIFPHICEICDATLCDHHQYDYTADKDTEGNHHINHGICDNSDCLEMMCKINCLTDDPDYWKCDKCNKITFIPSDEYDISWLAGSVCHHKKIFTNEIYKLKEENRQLKEKIIELKYRPPTADRCGGSGYEEAKADFESHKN